MTRRHKLAAIAGFCLLAAAASFWMEVRLRRPGATELWFFDVGQGDAALIRSPDGRSMLIDGGLDDTVLEGLAAALPWWQKKIDVILVTHLDTDHFVGLFGVLKKYRIGEIWWTGVAPNTATARRFVAAVEDAGIRQRFVQRGERFDFGGQRTFEALFPAEDLRGRIVSKTTTNAKGGGTNDYGVVGRFDCGAERALYAADVSSHVEDRLIADGTPLQAELLKVPHHGSRYSSSDAFLDAVAPREAVISVGAGNRYGHPTARVLAALLERGIRVRRTDREGTILYVCADGKLRAGTAKRWWKL